MKGLIFLFILTCKCFLATSQSIALSNFSDGIYHSIDDFFSGKVDTLTKIRKVNLDVPTDLAFADTIVKRTYFIDKDRQLIKKVFAVKYKGQLYFQEYGIHKNLDAGIRPIADNDLRFFCPVLLDGRYLYAEIVGRRGFGVGANYGGGLAGVMLSRIPDTSSNLDVESAVVLNPVTRTFHVFNSCKQVSVFLEKFHPESHIDCGESAPVFQKAPMDLEVIRKVFSEMK